MQSEILQWTSPGARGESGSKFEEYIAFDASPLDLFHYFTGEVTNIAIISLGMGEENVSKFEIGVHYSWSIGPGFVPLFS